MNPHLKQRLFAAAAALIAVWLGVQIAGEALTLPVLVVGALGLLVLVRVQPLPLDTLLLGAAVFCYIVGNRGFAQLSLAGRVPLLPAEFVLLVAGGIMLVQCAWRRELPVPRDALAGAILGWMLVCSARLVFDLRANGAMALRDYATVYYAAFFFLGAEAGRHADRRRFLRGCLLAACATLLVVYPLFQQFPGFFLERLTVRGAPVIYYKDDLAGTFLAVGAVLFYFRYEQKRSRWLLGLSLALGASALASNNRAAMLGLAAATALLAAAGRWRFALWQAAAGVVGALLVLAFAHVAEIPLERTPVYGAYERVLSLADPLGERTYRGTETFAKGDNNLFRAVWWRAVATETWQGGPWFGLGFGRDLAERFVREYYPDPSEDFSTRSPHNVLLTVFARTGAAGLLPFLVVIALVLRRLWRAAAHGVAGSAALWCGAWVILTSACLGVVLEGPMGAVVFWTMLGLANATPLEIARADAVPADAALPAAAEAVSTGPT